MDIILYYRYGRFLYGIVYVFVYARTRVRYTTVDVRPLFEAVSYYIPILDFYGFLTGQFDEIIDVFVRLTVFPRRAK